MLLYLMGIIPGIAALFDIIESYLAYVPLVCSGEGVAQCLAEIVQSHRCGSELFSCEQYE